MIDLKIEVLTEDEQAQMRRLEQACIQADKKKEDYYHANHKNIMDALNEVKPASIYGESTEPYYTLDDFKEGEELCEDSKKKRKEYQDFMEQLDRYEIRERYKANILMQDDEVEALRNDFIRVINSVTRKDYNEWKAKLKDTTSEQDGELMTLCLYECVRLPFMTALTRIELETKDEVLKDRYDKLLTELNTKLIPNKISELTGTSKKAAKELSMVTYKEQVTTFNSPAIYHLLMAMPNGNNNMPIPDEYNRITINGKSAKLVQTQGENITINTFALSLYIGLLYKETGKKTVKFSLYDYEKAFYGEKSAKELEFKEGMSEKEKKQIIDRRYNHSKELLDNLDMLFDCVITYENKNEGKGKKRTKDLNQARIIQDRAIKDGIYITCTLSDQFQKHFDSSPTTDVHRDFLRLITKEKGIKEKGTVLFKLYMKLQTHLAREINKANKDPYKLNEIRENGVRRSIINLLGDENEGERDVLITQNKKYDSPSRWKDKYKKVLEEKLDCLVDVYKYYSTWKYENKEGYEVTIDDEQNKIIIYKEGEEVIEDLTLEKWKELWIRYIPR